MKDDAFVGRVLLNRSSANGDSNNAGIRASLKASAQQNALGYRPRNDLKYARRSIFMKKYARRPKRLRVKLKEAVAREAREIQTISRQYAKGALEEAARIVADNMAPESAKLQAIDLILNRAYGKPNQTNTNLNADLNGKTEQISSSELDDRIRETLERVAELTGGAAKAPPGEKRSTDLREYDRDPNSPKQRLN